ncbi:MAG: putative S-adenosylmethionine-dependent methyltransferase [Rhodoferax sp.]|nr:putative S-adenosylmethionine-dependent methyltransferase [Rhodoferax sp.]
MAAYRASSPEQQRTADLLALMPASGGMALDIGARDGHFSLLLAERFARVVALDLSRPTVVHPQIDCVEGNAAALAFGDRSLDFVFCAEVLEHIPPHILPKVCSEMERVAQGPILIGVPYRQDLRVGRSTCQGCGGENPPWGHVNSFDETRIATLFAGCRIEKTSFVGQNVESSNSLSAALMDLAGNPYGTYTQDEPCIHCGSALQPPPPRNLSRKVLTKMAMWSRRASESLRPPRGNWIHVLLTRRAA